MSTNNSAQNGQAPPPITMKDVFLRVYRLLHSKLTAVIVILAMAILVLIGTVVMQAPVSKYSDPESYSQWLQTAQARFGGWTAVMDFLGFFNMWISPLFLSVTVLLTLSIIACTVHRLPVLIDKTMKPRTHVSDRFFQNAQYRASIPVAASRSHALENVEKSLKKRHFRVVPDPQEPESRLFADRFRWGPFGTVVAHASFVILILAFAVSGFTGFDDTLEIAVGDTVDVGHNTGLTVTAESFQDSYDDMGHPIDYVSHLIVHEGEQVVADQEVRVNTPIVVDGVRFHQASFGIAATVTVMGPDSTALFEGPVPLKWTSNDGLNSIGRVDLPAQDLEVIVVAPASGQRTSNIEAGTVLFEIYKASTGERLDAVTVTQGTSEEIGTLTVSFQREQTYTGIIVRKDPGTWWMWVGSILLIIGMLMTFGFRHRRLWVWIEDEGETGARVHLASVEEPDSILEREFVEMVEEINKQSNPATT